MHLEETTLLTVRPIDTCIYQTEQSGKEPLPPSVKHQTTEYHYTNPENIMSKGFLEKRRKKTADRFSCQKMRSMKITRKYAAQTSRTIFNMIPIVLYTFTLSNFLNKLVNIASSVNRMITPRANPITKR